MSGKMVGIVFDHFPGSGGDLLLAVKLAENSNDNGCSVFPGVDLLARATRRDRRTVQRQLRRLEAAGWIEPVRYVRGGRGRACEYRINPDWLAACADTPDGVHVGFPNSAGAELSTDETPQNQKGGILPPHQNDKRAASEAQKGGISTPKGRHSCAAPTSGTVIEPSEIRAPEARCVGAGVDNPTAQTPCALAEGSAGQAPGPQTGQAVKAHRSSPSGGKDRHRTPGGTELPEGWAPHPEDLSAMAAEVGLSAADIASRYGPAFADICRAKAYRYRDWRAAFRSCVRQDWPGYRSGSSRPGQGAAPQPAPEPDALLWHATRHGVEAVADALGLPGWGAGAGPTPSWRAWADATVRTATDERGVDPQATLADAMRAIRASTPLRAAA